MLLLLAELLWHLGATCHPMGPELVDRLPHVEPRLDGLSPSFCLCTCQVPLCLCQLGLQGGRLGFRTLDLPNEGRPLILHSHALVLHVDEALFFFSSLSAAAAKHLLVVCFIWVAHDGGPIS